MSRLTLSHGIYLIPFMFIVGLSVKEWQQSQAVSWARWTPERWARAVAQSTPGARTYG